MRQYHQSGENGIYRKKLHKLGFFLHKTGFRWSLEEIVIHEGLRPLPVSLELKFCVM